MHQKQHGFSPVIVPLVLIIFVLVGFIGWYVWRNDVLTSKNTTGSNSGEAVDTPVTDTEPKQITSKQAYKVPVDYTAYTNDTLGFSMAYPKQWGELMGTATAEIDNEPIGDSWLQGKFSINADAKDTFEIAAKKYGATVAPVKSGNAYTWKVTGVNPADTTDKIGSVYAVKTLVSAQGVTLYDFASQDEGATTARWAFEAHDQFITLSLPAILMQYMQKVSAADMAEYNKIVKNIQDSITINTKEPQ